jgi:hypothetical protein
MQWSQKPVTEHLFLYLSMAHFNTKKKKIQGLVHQRTTPTEWPLLVGEVSANFSR